MDESLPAGRPNLGWVATGIGSLPGTDPREAARIVAGELPEWPHLPELPARGVGADMIGRAMGLLSEVSSEFAVETSSDGWRRTARPGKDLRRAVALFQQDCETAEEQFAAHKGRFTVALAGPWTLAASVTDARGERSLRDHGYVSDLCRAHGEAAAGVVRRFARMLPQAQVVVSVDEPMLLAVHQGALPYSSGYRRHAPVGEEELSRGLQHTRDAVRAAGGLMATHTCAAPVWSVLLDLRPDLLSLDVTLLRQRDSDDFGTWLESGAGTVWGVWPTAGSARRDEADLGVRTVTGWLHRLGLRADAMPGAGAVSPRCGLAGATGPQARAAMAGIREVARRLNEWEE